MKKREKALCIKQPFLACRAFV